MNSQNLRLETVKPVAPSTDAGPQAAVVTQHSLEIQSRQTKSRRYLYRRKRGRGPNDDYLVQESLADDTPTSWLSRLLSGWMFSLLLHCLLLLWLGSFITNIQTDGPLTLNFSTVDDVSDEISIDISPLELDSVFEEEEDALDSEVVEPDPAESLEDELEPLIAVDTANLLEDLEFTAESDSSMFEPVKMGTVGLDEGKAFRANSGKGKSSAWNIPKFSGGN